MEEKDAAIEALEAQKKAAEESYETQIRLLEDKKAAIQDEIDFLQGIDLAVQCVLLFFQRAYFGVRPGVTAEKT